MKAMILAAGFGTRLLPHTGIVPKPLFPLAGRPLLAILIEQLIHHGAEAIMVNTHHLHHTIEGFIADQHFPIPVLTRHEPEILGTGGAIKNVADFWHDTKLLVVNSDVFSDIDFAAVYRYHCQRPHPVTMVLHDYELYNTVTVEEGFITDFRAPIGKAPDGPGSRLAFTGIQVVDPGILSLIPAGVFCNIIDIYTRLIAQGGKIKAYLIQNPSWHDIGSPAGYQEAALCAMLPAAPGKAGLKQTTDSFQKEPLSGDGSDRRWYRLRSPGATLILADHGIHTAGKPSEAESYLSIGRHLFQKKVPVPAIYAGDAFSGLVLIEDLGDCNLQSKMAAVANDKEALGLYRTVIHDLIRLAFNGAKDFDPAWTYQTPRYDKSMIIEKECRYFVEAFLNRHMGLSVSYDQLGDEFENLADLTLQNEILGLMHRDVQSRNIMWHAGRGFFIDFQGARFGPIQYDLASLLMDPYVNLPAEIQHHLTEDYLKSFSARQAIDPVTFRIGYQCCRITRNLQILGAFGFLSTVKQKKWFAQYIPTALQSLQCNLRAANVGPFPKLMALVDGIQALPLPKVNPQESTHGQN
jgi:aminoglycoside/choline kinase family phosphotransferase/dTDP-glucose pyrophosphorylase